MTGRRIAGFLIGLVISGLAAAWLALNVDIAQVGDSLARANPIWIVPAFAVLAVQAFVRATRWANLASSATAQVVRPSRTLDPMLSGYFINAVLPGRVGELARTVILSRRESLRMESVAASVVIERAADVFALLLLAALAAALAGADAVLAIAGGAAGVFALIIVIRAARIAGRRLPSWLPPALARPAASFLESLSNVPARAVGIAVAVSACAWLGDGALVLLVGRALGIDIPVAAAVLIGLGGALGTALPAAPGYIATYELGAVAFGAMAGVPADAVVTVAILVHVLGVGSLGLAGAISLGRMGHGVRGIRLGRFEEGRSAGGGETAVR